MLVRTTMYLLLVQVLVVVVIAAAVPEGAAWLTLTGFVTAYYDSNFFALKLVAVPWTDPPVYFSVQTLTQMIALAAAGSALITAARVTSWQPGTLPDSAPAPKNSVGRAGSPPDAAPGGPAPKPPAA